MYRDTRAPLTNVPVSLCRSSRMWSLPTGMITACSIATAGSSMIIWLRGSLPTLRRSLPRKRCCRIDPPQLSMSLAMRDPVRASPEPADQTIQPSPVVGGKGFQHLDEDDRYVVVAAVVLRGLHE